MLLGLKLGLRLVELLLDRGLAVAQRRDLAGELIDLRVVARDLGGQHALLLLGLIELGLLVVELGAQVRGRGATGHGEDHHHCGDQDGGGRQAPVRAGASFERRHFHWDSNEAPQ